MEQTKTETLSVSEIKSEGRIRADLGDIDALCDSIQTFGIIQPIVIERDTMILVAGGRRLTAIKRLAWKALVHGQHFIWRDEETELRRRAVELEENIRRKELTWQEEVEGKKRLLGIMQSIHGQPVSGNTTRDPGFGVVKLAAMIGESASTTSRDLAVADAIERLPMLRKADTKGSAMQRMKLMATVIGMAVTAKTKEVASALITSTDGTPKPTTWTLYEGDFRDNISKIADESVDLIHTDLPYGSSVEKMSSHSNSGALPFDDSRETIVSMLPEIGREAYRILRPDRYACFWFGFNNYSELVGALTGAGFSVVPVPLIWIKNTKSGENPNTRYSNSYEAALIACKGSPILIRPGASNVKTFPTVPPAAKLHVAEKPIDLILDILRDLVPSNGVVVDLMAGSGSTGIAALRHNCKAILFEKEDIHCRIIKDRMVIGTK